MSRTMHRTDAVPLVLAGPTWGTAYAPRRDAHEPALTADQQSRCWPRDTLAQASGARQTAAPCDKIHGDARYEGALPFARPASWVASRGAAYDE